MLCLLHYTDQPRPDAKVSDKTLICSIFKRFSDYGRLSDIINSDDLLESGCRSFLFDWGLFGF